MGVNHLWDILSPVGYKISLDDLQNQTVAIDLSGWILESFKQKELACIKKPHIRNLFYRISYLLHLGIKPVFILEGVAPELKKAALSQRLKSDKVSESLCSRKHFQSVLRECKELIENLGLTCIQSCGEAEATCAFLNKTKHVDGCITDDSDAFLYGARVVYRDFSINPKDPHVIIYTMDAIEKKLNLDRRKLVALAILLGCDYNQTGVLGVGKEKAIKLLEKLKDKDILERFDQWKNEDIFSFVDTSLLSKKCLVHCNKCKHPGSEKKHSTNGCQFCTTEDCCLDNEISCPCQWHKAREVELEFNISKRALEDPEFPYKNIAQEYLNFKETFDKILIKWNRPSWTKLQNFMSVTLGWTTETNREKIIPLITLWQITMPDETGHHIFVPIRIIKECKRKFQKCVIVEWEWIDKNSDSVNETTTELKDLFKKKYPKLIEDYEMKFIKSGKRVGAGNSCKRKTDNTKCSKQQEVRNEKNLKELCKESDLLLKENSEYREKLQNLDINIPLNKREISFNTNICKKQNNHKDISTCIEESRNIKQKSMKDLIDDILDDSLSDLSMEEEKEPLKWPTHNIDIKTAQVNSDTSVIIIDSEEETVDIIERNTCSPMKTKENFYKKCIDKENIYEFSPLPLRERLKNYKN